MIGLSYDAQLAFFVGIGKKRIKEKDFCRVTIRQGSWDKDEVQMRKSGGALD